jgi:aspartate/methionine/tyrosine aminotransferase
MSVDGIELSNFKEQAAELPLDRERVQQIVDRAGFDVRSASIREMDKLVNTIESEMEIDFIRMEFGVPDLPVHPLAIEAERRALTEYDVAGTYAPFEGIPELKAETARFVKQFLNLDVAPVHCIPTVGAMEGCFGALALAGRLHAERRTILFLEPGFPVNKLQTRFLGLEHDSIDFYDHRGDDLIRAVEERAAKGDLCGIIWSSPNNPSWIILDESELRGLGEICDRHDLIAIEDLAYFGMDMRRDYLTPGKPPYQPTVMRYTSRGICIISSSKMFSYAGQRIAMTILSPELMETSAPDLETHYGTSNIGHAFVHGGLYPITASVPQSPQHGLRALLHAANSGDASLFEPAREYSRRAAIMKPLFLENGFHLVYDKDLDRPLADGFYFTVAHKAYDDGADLLRELLHYGISAITLEITGSNRKEGLRACVSKVNDDAFATLAERLRLFNLHHSA